MRSSSAVRVVAMVEALKGALVLVAAFGLLSLLHRDIEDLAVRIIEHFHLDPAAKYPNIFIHLAAHLHDRRLLLLALGATTYALIRFIEAYGLFYRRRWAEWLAAVSAAIYVPFEVMDLERHLNWLSLSVLLLNLGVVAVMVWALWNKKNSAQPRDSLPGGH